MPDQAVVREFARTRNPADIRENAENPSNKEPNRLRNFLQLLHHYNTRMVWGGMIAFSTIAGLQSDQIFPQVDEIQGRMASGVMITNDTYRQKIFPYLLKRFAEARPVEAPCFAETLLVSIGKKDPAEFITILDKWIEVAGNARLSRLRRVHRLAREIS
jgi:hypothetical protein